MQDALFCTYCKTQGITCAGAVEDIQNASLPKLTVFHTFKRQILVPYQVIPRISPHHKQKYSAANATTKTNVR